MRWHAEILIHGVLVLWMWIRKDGRPKFAAWLVTRFLFDAAQFLAERFGYGTESTGIWYAGVVFQAPLLLLAMHEAEGRWHRRILFAWVAFSMCLAWIRFFPYTGQAVLMCDAAAYVGWLTEKALQSKTPRQLSGPAGR